MDGFNFFLIYMGLIGSAFPLMACVVLLHVLMPQALLDRYWKLPHFRPAELAFFTKTVFAPVRTLMLLWVIAFPRFGKKRDIGGADRFVPAWYRFAARLIAVWLVAVGVALLLMTVGVFVHGYVVGDPVPLSKAS